MIYESNAGLQMIGFNQALSVDVDTVSRCKDCPVRNRPGWTADECVETCHKLPPKQPVFSLSERVLGPPKLICSFPGCKIKIHKGKLCKKHSKLVYRRKLKYPDDPSKWYAKSLPQYKKFPIVQLDLKTKKVLAEFANCADAQRQTGINASAIVKCVNGISKHSGGYLWRKKESSPIAKNAETKKQK